MKLEHGDLRLAATDLTTFAACTHASVLDREVAEGRLARPFRPDASAALLQARGLAHEQAYVQTLRQSQSVEELPLKAEDAPERTLDAMRRGAEVIYQGTLRHSRWLGRPDFLQRVDTPSRLGAWSYEAADAKLARSAKANALLQLCFYSELLLQVQGVLPSRMTIVLGGMRREQFATARYAAYFRYVRACLERTLVTPPTTYPEPVDHCSVCAWFADCDARRRVDDHLSLVAGISTSQRRALEVVAVQRVHQLAAFPLLRSTPVDGIGFAALTRIREQARIQVEGRLAGALRYELLPSVEQGRGLALLPEPSPGDLFLDFEGDPYALGDGIEYLLGIIELPSERRTEPQYTALWAFDRAGERSAFEQLIRIIMERRARDPLMHVYHYNHYEPTALKRLAGRHATCVDELDALLRGRVLVDLFKAVRQGLRASVESYSLKRVEALYGFVRAVPLRDANACLAAFEAWLELRDTSSPHDELRDAIQGYNRDDCLSTMHLRAWLEDRRRELEQRGMAIARPPLVPGDPSAGLAEQLDRVRSTMRTLLESVPADFEQRDEEQNARFVLAHLLEWHRREDKSAWWEYYRLCDLSDDELQEDKTAIGGLTYEGVARKEKRSFVHRYRFPPQDHTLDRALTIHDELVHRRAPWCRSTIPKESSS